MALVNRLTSITRPLMMICRQFSDVSADLKSVVSSLTSKRKHVPHWYLYDTRGSEIYEEIVRTSSTYNLWNHEYTLLQTHVKDIVGNMSSPTMLVELGSGASSKTRPVIEALLERQTALTYVPVDIAKDYIWAISRELEREYSSLKVEPFGGLYMDGLRHVACHTGPKLLLFLGSSFGNVPIDEQLPMMKEIKACLKVQDRLVLGLDMNTDREAVVRAYVAENTRCPWLDNLIERLNKDFEADMDKMAFEDTVDFVENPAGGDRPSYVQQYLRSSTAQRLHLKKPGLAIDFQAGERLYLSEGPNYSCKYSENQVRRLAEKSNFAVEGFWADELRKPNTVWCAWSQMKSDQEMNIQMANHNVSKIETSTLLQC
ncbi:histidine N-alpha-methyltransferase-like [Branchiostoma lanceolatum]|uniref:histidine N-alpha-methyltransferase-like n=1 Tax=Branchiostoma lanceolatum TaxID=7740 RepID=UPI003452EB40